MSQLSNSSSASSSRLAGVSIVVTKAPPISSSHDQEQVWNDIAYHSIILGILIIASLADILCRLWYFIQYNCDNIMTSPLKMVFQDFDKLSSHLKLEQAYKKWSEENEPIS